MKNQITDFVLCSEEFRDLSKQFQNTYLKDYKKQNPVNIDDVRRVQSLFPKIVEKSKNYFDQDWQTHLIGAFIGEVLKAIFPETSWVYDRKFESWCIKIREKQYPLFYIISEQFDYPSRKYLSDLLNDIQADQIQIAA